MELKTAGTAAVRDLLDGGALRALYQPIVDLDTGAVEGYEALARGPEGSRLECPGSLFPEAIREGLLSELDHACRTVAVEGAIAAGLCPPQTLFVNVEPSTLGGDDPLLVHQDELRADEIRLVVEFTERALAARPADVLAAVAWLRSHGCGIALDDVGADPRSLALLPLLAPDVIKLDLTIVQDPSPATAHVVNAAAAECERSGALLLAEGIETEEHLLRARAMGATLGQGWLFGRPAPLVGSKHEAGPGITPRPAPETTTGTPFELVADRRRLRRGDKRLLLQLSRQLEAEAGALGPEAVVLTTFQDDDFFTAASRDRYIGLARRAAFVGVFGVGVSEEPAPGVRGARLEPGDPLRGEWDVVVISPHFAGAFVARDLGDHDKDADRRFEFFLTYDRDLVTLAARSLMVQIVPAGVG